MFVQQIQGKQTCIQIFIVHVYKVNLVLLSTRTKNKSHIYDVELFCFFFLNIGDRATLSLACAINSTTVQI